MLPITARVIWSDVLLYKHDKYLFIPPHLAAEYCFGPGQWALTIFLIAMKGHNRNYFLKSLFIFLQFWRYYKICRVCEVRRTCPAKQSSIAGHFVHRGDKAIFIEVNWHSDPPWWP